MLTLVTSVGLNLNAGLNLSQSFEAKGKRIDIHIVSNTAYLSIDLSQKLNHGQGDTYSTVFVDVYNNNDKMI